MTSRKCLVVLAAAVVTFAVPSLRATTASAAAPTVIQGSVPTVVADGKAALVAPRQSSDSISISVGLSLRDANALAQFLKQLNDPSSPYYHKYISQTEANQLFNPSAAQEQQVASWLQANGLTVTKTYANHLLVDATGTVGQVESLFHVTLNQYKATVRGKESTFYAPNSDPTIDASVSGVVQTVVGLDSYPRFFIPKIAPDFTNGNTATMAPLYPQNLAAAYDVTPLWNAGYTGAGQHIGITLWEPATPDATLNAFKNGDATNSFPASGADVATRANGRLNVINVGTPPDPAVAQDVWEAGLDIETTSGIAPAATIDYYAAPTDSAGNPTDQGLLSALNDAGTDSHNNGSIDNSWGGCEASVSDPWQTSAENIFSSNAATGHNYFFASGDQGAYCNPNDPATWVKYPDYPASSPHVTSVGGTSFGSGTPKTDYSPETSWSCTGSSDCSAGNGGSGGGYSLAFARPSWQTAPSTSGLLTTGTLMRGYPDVSADADPNTGAYVCAGSSTDGTYGCGGVGGTSLATPLWAGMTAILNEYLAANSKPALGFLDPILYNLANNAQSYAPFHDVTSGSNGAYNAGASWDAVTGWGSPDLYNMARDLAGTSGSGGTGGTTGPGTSQLVTNGDFESGLTSWTTSSTNGNVGVSTAQAHGGTNSLHFCGKNYCIDQAYQNLTLPSANITQATLTYWIYMATQETTIYCYDSFLPQLETSAGTVFLNATRTCDANTNGWVKKTYNFSTTSLNSHKGQTVRLNFRAVTNATRPTDFYLDDVTLNVTTGTAPSPTPTPSPSPSPSPTPTGTCPSSPNTALNGCVNSVLAMLNHDRANNPQMFPNGVVTNLTLNTTQTTGTSSCVGSYGHSVHMAATQTMAHDQFPADVCIPWNNVGENIGYGGGDELTTLQSLDASMMGETHSPSYCQSLWNANNTNHACNIINPAFHQVGIGIYVDSYGTTWLTEDFTN